MYKNTRILFSFLLLYVTVVVLSDTFALEPPQSTQELRSLLQKEMQRAKTIQNKKRQLERTIQSSQSHLKKFNRILRNYQYNLDQSQKVIDAAQREISHISERNERREHLFANCLKILGNYYPYNPVEKPGHRLSSEIVSEAIVDIAHVIFKDMQAEQPRMTELLQVIQDKQALQERILNKYLPNDLEKKELHEQVVNKKSEEVKQIRAQSTEIQNRIAAIRRQIATAEKEIQNRILEERKKAEQKRREEEKKRAQPSSPQSKKIPVTQLPQTPPQAGYSNQPIATQKGTLPWPARGTIVRPFGEFTHPQYGVKIKSYGVNIRVASNQPIRAVAGGQVIYIGEIAGFGHTLLVNHGSGYVTVYGNVKPEVSIQQTISSGQVIGRTIGVEYHFEIRHDDQALNPEVWLVPRLKPKG